MQPYLDFYETQSILNRKIAHHVVAKIMECNKNTFQQLTLIEKFILIRAYFSNKYTDSLTLDTAIMEFMTSPEHANLVSTETKIEIASWTDSTILFPKIKTLELYNYKTDTSIIRQSDKGLSLEDLNIPSRAFYNHRDIPKFTIKQKSADTLFIGINEIAMDYDFEVLGLVVEETLLRKCSGRNGNFCHTKKEGEQYIFLLKYGGERFTLTLYETQGECPSGWCVAQWGRFQLKKVQKFKNPTHLFKKRLRKHTQFIKLTLPMNPSKIDDINDRKLFNNDEFIDSIDTLYGTGYMIKNFFLSCSFDGGDQYYPCGYVKVDYNSFDTF